MEIYKDKHLVAPPLSSTHLHGKDLPHSSHWKNSPFGLNTQITHQRSSNKTSIQQICNSNKHKKLTEMSIYLQKSHSSVDKELFLGIN